jgi:hypothetical protein
VNKRLLEQQGGADEQPPQGTISLPATGRGGKARGEETEEHKGEGSSSLSSRSVGQTSALKSGVPHDDGLLKEEAAT